MKVLVLNGPNLGRLDLRDNSIYGSLDFSQLKAFIENAATENNLSADVRQSDSEVEIIQWLHSGLLQCLKEKQRGGQLPIRCPRNNNHAAADAERHTHRSNPFFLLEPPSSQSPQRCRHIHLHL